MDNKRDIERAELHKTIWGIADQLRGSVDGWDFKQYILGFLFYRYISENLTNYINKNEQASGNSNFNYENMSDEDAMLAKDDIVNMKGFFIKPSELFANVRKSASNNPDLNQTLRDVFSDIENSAQGTESEGNFKGLFDEIDTNSKKLGSSVARINENLTKILNGIGEMKLGDIQDNSIDAFGDAYEYLMSMYASNAGKSGGEFFTPQEVSELLTRLAIYNKDEINKIYDPACGSGSLLLNVAKILGKDHVREGFFGQDINITNYNLCRINMFLHDIDFDKFNIEHGDTLVDPKQWDDQPFDIIVSNPPYSTKWAGKSNPLLINDSRYAPAGVLAPEGKADFAFIMHSLAWLSSTGTASIVCFPGIFYRGGAEEKIRQYLVDNNFVDAIIQLPGNLFFGTGIATCIMVMKKSKENSDVLFIDGSNDFIKVGNTNKLTEENITEIVNRYGNRENVDHRAKVVSNRDIAENKYNLSVNSYVEKEDTREKINIQEVNQELEQVVAKGIELRSRINEIIKELGE